MSNCLMDTFLQLLRQGIGNGFCYLPEEVDWISVKSLADEQGLLAVVLDSIEFLPEYKRPPKVLLLDWIGNTLQAYEQRYALYRKAISSLARFYGKHGYKMMLLKGYASSLDWPKPEHRPCGDIDIWQFGRQKETDRILAERGVLVDTSHHHHTVFEWHGFTVENHYDFVNVYAHKSSRELERIFKELGQDDSFFVDVEGEIVYLPSPNLNALFLIRHMANHFVSSEITLRQVLDWAFFAKKHSAQVDWKWLCDILKEYHIIDFFNCINAICVEDLGFESRIFYNVQFTPELKNRVLKDIIYPDFRSDIPRGFVNRIRFKLRRWKGNAWKHQLVYKESMWSAFWSGVWNHLLKPCSI